MICDSNQDSPDQWPMLINADQNSSINPNVDQFRSMPINALRGIDWNWSALIGIERHFVSMPWFWSTLIDIDRHWALIEGVLSNVGLPLSTVWQSHWTFSKCEVLMYCSSNNIHSCLLLLAFSVMSFSTACAGIEPVTDHITYTLCTFHFSKLFECIYWKTN